MTLQAGPALHHRHLLGSPFKIDRLAANSIVQDCDGGKPAVAAGVLASLGPAGAASEPARADEQDFLGGGLGKSVVA